MLLCFTRRLDDASDGQLDVGGIVVDVLALWEPLRLVELVSLGLARCCVCACVAGRVLLAAGEGILTLLVDVVPSLSSERAWDWTGGCKVLVSLGSSFAVPVGVSSSGAVLVCPVASVLVG